MISLSNYKKTPILGFTAFSGTGKTTLLEQLIPDLNQAQIRVAMVKHTHHEKFDIDHPGKDSYRLRKAGAGQVLVASSKRWALMVEHNDQHQQKNPEPDLFSLLAHIDLTMTDLILVEGFKHEAFSKIEIHRPELGKPLLYPDDRNIIAIATNAEEALKYNREIKCPVLDINNISQISSFISRQISLYSETIN
jgi:molybdopterin-guanine dinucleotide biosynthesis protein B